MGEVCEVINQQCEDQLTGVDTAYFYKMIDSIKTYNSPITPEYLSTIIDRIF